MPQQSGNQWIVPFATKGSGVGFDQAFPFGPRQESNETKFSNSLGVALPSDSQAQACVSGHIRCIEGPSDQFSLILQPNNPSATRLKPLLLGSTNCAFVYRLFDKNAATALHKSLSPPPPPTTLDAPKVPTIKDNAFPTLDQFLQEMFSLPVKVGAALGRPLLAVLEFEVVFLPPIFFNQLDIGPIMAAVKAVLSDAVSPGSTARRLDPVTFYSRAGFVSGTDKSPIFSHCEQRLLLEFRNEFDGPYDDPDLVTLPNVWSSVSIQCSADPSISSSAFGPLNKSGVVVVQFAASASGAAISVSRDGYELVQLPESKLSYSDEPFTFAASAPEHVQLQTICLDPGSGPESWFVVNTESTVFVIGDPLVPDPPAFSSGNRVTLLRDGVRSPKTSPSADTSGFFDAFFEQLKNLQKDDVVLLANWFFDHTLQLLPLNTEVVKIVDNTNQMELFSGTQITLFQLLQACANKGVIIRALIFDPQDTDLDLLPGGTDRINEDAVTALNALAGVSAISDSPPGIPPRWTGYHQKFSLLVCRSGFWSTGFVGGIDFNPNRLDSPQHLAQSAYHDVHTMIKGPALSELWRTFRQRWNALTITDPIGLWNSDTYHWQSIPGQFLDIPKHATHHVQVARTYSVRFAPLIGEGSRTPRDAFLNAIRKAKHFIFIEDQYLHPFAGPNRFMPDDLEVLTELTAALERPDFRFLILVIPHHLSDSDQENHRDLFIDMLVNIAPTKVKVFYPVRTSGKPDPRLSAVGEKADASGSIANPGEMYVHTKIWVVDDICAKVGSANCNRRSYTNDHEMDVVVIDSAVSDGVRPFARDLRISLWAEHLEFERYGMDPKLLSDCSVGVAYLTLFAAANFGRLRKFENRLSETFDAGNFIFWELVDPYGGP